MDQWTSNKLPERLPFSKKRLPKRVIFSYILDYVIIVVLIVTFYIIDKVEPFHQPFSLENYTLHYPYAVHERIPVLWLCVICVAAPAIIIGIYTMVIDGLFSHKTAMPTARGVKRLTGRYRFKDRLWELNCGILGLGLSVCAAFTITGALKNAIGKPRPDLIARCEINPDVRDKFTDVDFRRRLILQTVAICTQTDNYILQDGFKSFPSGHSSSAFAGLFYLSLYLAAKMHVLDSKGEVWKAFIVMVPTLAAALVAGSRIMDARHHPFDVLSGSALGILVAWGSYRQYFPPVTETWHKGRAYPIRAWGREPVAPPHPTIRIDEDVRPLQPMRRPTDEERGPSSGFSSETAVAGNDAAGGNVFRQQISQSQRRRGDGNAQFGDQRSDTMGSTISTKVNRYQSQMPGANPFNGDSTSTRGHRQDNYDYSSSEDDDNYELQQTYTLSAPQNGGVYNPVQGTYTNTGYHPPHGIGPSPTPPPPGLTAGDIGDSRREAGPTVPPHSVGTTPQQI
ncbi:acid phosphatase/Vanadium-dependent haloperoxidase [Melanomma pulvis-pyrius CBS 109.77]|uniref:Acid phosphatase/Vanadium-dependent haloperoxidase n=1 Tax=Melanomma pulvis-pyrius CBS 109.77 TaxID=1314802 RepID=A0A6A6X453_9PLEO|nr:acid phosphatase/Vanadium-dependent haloperoxidase [Melanomma pulvis-pyrius CBS 109.77]